MDDPKNFICRKIEALPNEMLERAEHNFQERIQSEDCRLTDIIFRTLWEYEEFTNALNLLSLNDRFLKNNTRFQLFNSEE